jgi:hypothetical protein
MVLMVFRLVPWTLFPHTFFTFHGSDVISAVHKRRKEEEVLMVRGLSSRPNLPERPAATWNSRWSIKEEEEA